MRTREEIELPPTWTMTEIQMSCGCHIDTILDLSLIFLGAVNCQLPRASTMAALLLLTR